MVPGVGAQLARQFPSKPFVQHARALLWERGGGANVGFFRLGFAQQVLSASRQGLLSALLHACWLSALLFVLCVIYGARKCWGSPGEWAVAVPQPLYTNRLLACPGSLVFTCGPACRGGRFKLELNVAWEFCQDQTCKPHICDM